ncbi:EpsG family protein [Vibrio profundum]|uniref:EpsG family protein n=1 Tax=Vibrio profundum TaxID=2910247 RepID=UPI003D0E2790
MIYYRDLGLIVSLYIGTLALLLAVNFYSNKNSRGISYLFLLLIFIFFSLLVSLRPLDAGNDTIRYVTAFNHLGSVSKAYDVGKSYFGNTEFGFWRFAAMAKKVLVLPEVFIFSIGSLAFLLLCSVSRKMIALSTSNESFYLVPMIVLCSLSTYLFVYMGNHIRTSIAIPLSYLMIYYAFIDKQRIKGYLLGALAFSLHFSVILAFASKLALSINKKSSWFCIVLASVILAKVMPAIVGMLINYLPFLDAKYELYFQYNHVAEFNSIFTLTNFKVLALAGTVSLFLFNGGVCQKLFLFFFSCILLLSPVAQVSERYFPYAFLIMFVSLYESLYFIKERHRVYLLAPIALILFIVTVYSESARYTLGI